MRGKLETLPGVERVEVNPIEREVSVTHGTTAAALLVALHPLDIGAVLAPEPGAAAAAQDTASPTRSAASVPEWVPLVGSGLLAAAAEIFAWSTRQEPSAAVITLAVLSILLGDGTRCGRGGSRSATASSTSTS